MSRAKLEIEGFDAVLKKLESIGADSEKIAEEALKKGFQIMTEKASSATYPAGGRYASGRTSAALVRSPKVEWNGTEASVPVGFNVKQAAPSIFMMYGTPRYMKVQAMYDAFYGDSTQGEVLAAAKEIFLNAMGEHS